MAAERWRRDAWTGLSRRVTIVAMTNLLKLSLRRNATGAEGAVQYPRWGRHRIIDFGIWLF